MSVMPSNTRSLKTNKIYNRVSTGSSRTSGNDQAITVVSRTFTVHENVHSVYPTCSALERGTIVYSNVNTNNISVCVSPFNSQLVKLTYDELPVTGLIDCKLVRLTKVMIRIICEGS